MVKIEFIRGVKLEDVRKWIRGFFNADIYFRFYGNGNIGENLVFRAFDPRRIEVVLEHGSDRTSDYVGPLDREEIIYAGSLRKSLEYAERYMVVMGRACISVYSGDMLEEIDFYTYRPKDRRTYKEALLKIICLEE